MDTFTLRIYQKEVERQCKHALMAANDLKRALKSSNQELLWYSVQALLIAAGNISKLFWSSDESLPDRGTQLRNSLSIDDGHFLRNRKFRNHFEHFDERLDRWASESEPRGFLVDSNIGSKEQIKVGNAVYLRNFDPNEYSVTFYDDEYPLKDVIAAIEDILKVVSIESNKPSW